MAENRNTGDFGHLVSESKDYIDLKVDEFKLKATKGLSIALSRTLSYLLIIAVLAITLGLVAFALLQWINSLVGAPWGTLIVGGVFLIALIALWVVRNRLFTDTFVKIFIDAFYNDDKDEQ